MRKERESRNAIRTIKSVQLDENSFAFGTDDDEKNRMENQDPSQ